ncbi:vanadium-dependent haloperoxidase [Methylomonas sp. HYX-M1]|uniref:vanadium-dependent haloperoxidase n=1 Tax=Methylomonas sp. HYX-M1 TaxID=3139307 RepID=UPI00345BF1DB
MHSPLISSCYPAPQIPGKFLFAVGFICLIFSLSTQSVWAMEKSQKQCFSALQAAHAKVFRLAGNHAAACLKKSQRSGADPESCLSSPTKALRKAQMHTEAVLANKCELLPEIGPNSSEAINATTNLLKQLFGDDLNSALATATDSAGEKCRNAAAQTLNQLQKLEFADYLRRSAKSLKKNRMESSEDLAACLETTSVALNKARNKAVAKLTKACEGVDLADALPGRCASAQNAEALAQCVVGEAHCGLSERLNLSDNLQVSGHTFQNGVASHYCGVKPESAFSIARQWNEENLAAIRIDTPRPPVHARNLFHLSAAMYDAWAAYDDIGKGYFVDERIVSDTPQQDREIAISFAAYRILAARYSSPLALGYATSQQRFAALMSRLGLDPAYTDSQANNPAAVGNRIAARILAAGMEDGSNQAGNYSDSGYQAVNKPLIVKEPDIFLTDASDPAYQLNPNRWQPLALDKTVTQNGIPLPDKIQTFIGSQWGAVSPFASQNAGEELNKQDYGRPPLLGTDSDSEYKRQALQVVRMSGYLSPDDDTTIDISPAALGNNALGSNDGHGYAKNPVTGQAYAPQIVKRGDFGRVLAEYWADGPTSETPPGHWNLIANQVADTAGFTHRFAGQGPSLDRLEWDVKTYFALNGATHDAAIASWGAKRIYDSARPITMIRYMAKLGQSSDATLPSYHPQGIPLEDGLVELISAESAASGQRHAHLLTAQAGGTIGDIAILAWPGSPDDIHNQYSGVRWVLGKAWVPYQRKTFVTPAFPGYCSGHSTFSRSAAEVLTAITGSPYFPGGFAETVFAKNSYLIHEQGPSENIRLQWAGYYDMSDQAGQSRLWGGIHIETDDFAGRLAGSVIGKAAFRKAQSYFDGSAQ